ncbi:MAG: quinol:electron acceptor oxidoreductase subunit ActD [Blastocatellia bacterium]
MEKIRAIFNSHDEAIAALGKLERVGVPPAQITLMSSEPVHVEAGEQKSRIGPFAIAGGLTGAVVAVILTVWTSHKVDLVTGGMPVVAPWAFGIIVFELSMLGAILGALCRMIYEARLLRRNSFAEHDYDEAIADGRVLLAIDTADDARAQLIRAALGESLVQ